MYLWIYILKRTFHLDENINILATFISDTAHIHDIVLQILICGASTCVQTSPLVCWCWPQSDYLPSLGRLRRSWADRVMDDQTAFQLKQKEQQTVQSFHQNTVIRTNFKNILVSLQTIQG